MDDSEIGPLHLLVRDRTRIQSLALDLLTLMRTHRTIRAADEGGRNAYDLLVGAVFSLWRAVFLASVDADWEDVLVRAETFLEKVIRHNAIGYMDDWNNRKWSFLYYLNNARYRLIEAAEIVPKLKKELEKYPCIYAMDERFLGVQPTDSFNGLCNAIDEAIHVLRNQGDAGSEEARP